MRIIIDMDTDRRRRMVRVRMRRYANSADGVAFCNAGLETYNLIKDAFANCTEGAYLVDEGEAK